MKLPGQTVKRSEKGRGGFSDLRSLVLYDTDENFDSFLEVTYGV